MGTVSLLKIDESTFELAKLAVTEKYQGLKIGRQLMEKCLAVAKEQQVKKIILYTNHRLNAALILYRKFGFQEIPMKQNKYLEADIQMELSF
ncbi:acetyltransferase (GNAT) family protein [Hydrogenispora ethanolica]|uniref:Acetyltransferase (GNAT) family protein n=1 Tax=Hydrogenispora ethanolica TaxID=1082276 RepID=A0A4R1RAH3_HYDET|nr:GNAT family N-acetyltransferase [Hydrogenispora ethanolica]TCL62764.1 acetyltransferase (GNAT) family protein [Hydrogenispora ethanolica]